LSPPIHALPIHEFRSECPVGFELVVRSTSESQTVHGAPSSTCKRLHVIEFQKAALDTPMSIGADERAPTAIALPHGAANACGDIALPRRLSLDAPG
jgi:hypothetical protein